MHPSLKTLGEINHEDWAQRYKNSFILYDKKCYYVQDVTGRGTLLLNDGSVEPEAELPPRARFTTTAAPRRTSLWGARWNIVAGHDKAHFYGALGEPYHNESWFENQEDSRLKARIWSNIEPYFRGVNILHHLVCYWNQGDQDEFIRLMQNYSQHHFHIGLPGWEWNNGDTTPRVRNQLIAALTAVAERYFDRWPSTTQVEYERYQGATSTGRTFVFEVGTIGIHGLTGAAPPRQPEPEPEEQNIVVDWGQIAADMAAKQKKKSSYTSVKVDVSKLCLDRPESRWFLSDGEPYFISYSTAKQYKRGLTSATAALFSSWKDGSGIMIAYPSHIPAKLGCPLYEAAYLYKNPTRVRKTTNQITDEVKAKNYSYLSPYFLVSKDSLYYKNVKLGVFKDGVFGLGISAFRQEINELVYNPVIEHHYGENKARW